MHLILAFFTCGGIWALLQAEFLAIAIIPVYVGAVMVLFLFVVMMLDINMDRIRQGFWQYLPLGALLGMLMVAEMGLVLGSKYFRYRLRRWRFGRHLEYQGYRNPDVHWITFILRVGVHRVARRHDRGHRPDLSGLETQQIHQPERPGLRQGQGSRPCLADAG
ncbi:MAG: NADH-quinone oxidoreductase subunit J [Azonexus sp.]